MSYLIERLSIDLKTGTTTSTIIEEVDGHNRAEELLIQIFAEKCLKWFQENQNIQENVQRQNLTCKDIVQKTIKSA